ncbi:DUF3995 domain-containing protein [Jannaschia aquimarina]|uniref:DUF3995 domain-containing protein n=1 Tax=Jannaschia aquimarina TaxID=935700 RepID=A0A0D1EJY9_9RHOB|nr:DUF3995 domain-containing protein [Jannaschia aquimarina]KIT16125.1 hypothetical protein jaqu_20870 [Jannaschia aquimarina]SNT37393.1 Protein of unknown function [Jannaschia aquimarina]
MIVSAVIWTVVLLDLAALHAAWAARIWLPLGDEAATARAVVGTPGIEKMPSPILCGAIAALLALLATLPWWDFFGLARAALLASGVVLALRGVAAYLPAWARITPEQPFRKLDRAAYGPICLALSLLAFTIGGAM